MDHKILHQGRSTTDSFTCEEKTLELYECEVCSYTTALKVDLKEHFRVFHEAKNCNSELARILKCYDCEKCDFLTHSLLVLAHHDQRCNSATNSAKKENVLPRYKKTQHNQCQLIETVTWWKCKLCPYKTTVKCRIKMHIAFKHDIPEALNWFKCEHCTHGCQSSRTSKKNTQITQTSVTPVDKHTSLKEVHFFKCYQCFFQTLRKSTLKRHLTEQHGDPKNINWLKCDTCSYKTKIKRDLSNHRLAKHTDLATVNWVECKQCPYRAINKSNLTRHTVRRHTDPENIKWLKCGHCTFQTKYKYELKKHINQQHIEPEHVKWFFNCEYCSFRTKSKCSLEIHNILKHPDQTEVIWFTCEQCPFKTYLKAYLQRHIRRVHSNNCFKCVLCSFQAKSESCLINHNLCKHTDPENVSWFECQLCSYKGTQKQYLRRHVSRVHNTSSAKNS